MKILLPAVSLVTSALTFCALSLYTPVFAQSAQKHQETYTLYTTELIKPYEASYTVRKFGMKAYIDTSLTINDDDVVTYTKHTKPKGLAKRFLNEATETSVFKITENGLQVQTYSLTASGKDSSRDEYFSIDSVNQTISGEARGKKFNAAASDNLMDRASMEIMLMLDANKRTNLSYEIVDRTNIKTYQFEYLGQKSVKTAGKNFTCDEYKVTRSSGKRSTSLCMAESLGFLPVMVTHTEKGSATKALMNSQNFIDE